MERFFLEHHVMKDCDQDELDRRKINSDSEASDDEEEITDRVHSVADPTGPWKQTPMDSSWGQPNRKSTHRVFKSVHTGPKGVINDYKAHKRYQRQQRARQEEERREMLNRITKGASTVTAHRQPPVEQCSEDSDCDCDDLLNDDFLQQYRELRMQQMQSMAANRFIENEKIPKRKVFGSLEYISPTEFVEIIDTSESQQRTIVHLYHPENYACELFNQHLGQLAQQLSHVKFAAMIAKDADPSISMEELPVLLVYCGQQQEEVVVDVSHQLDGEFTYERIAAFVHKFL